jgi:3-oxoacyl-[acyl-carrier protein] reductase
MEFGLNGRRVLLIGPDVDTLSACAATLVEEGVEIVTDVNADRADIVIATGRRDAGSSLVDVSEPEILEAAWSCVMDAVDSYQRSLSNMIENEWGRFVWVGSAQAKSVDAEEDELNSIVTLGMLGLNKVLTGENARYGITANTVLRTGSVADDEVAATVAFLCSTGAGYLSGVTVTVDGGAGSAVF